MRVRRMMAAAAGGVTAVSLALATGAGAASLEADYRFDDNLTSSVPGVPALTNIGPGANAFATATVDGSPDRVLTFPESNGVRMPMTQIIDPADFSVITTFALDATDSYRRIIQFEPDAEDSDAGFYVYDTALDFYSNTADEVIGPPGALTDGTFSDITFTRSANGAIRAYAGDALQIALVDQFDEALIGSDGLRFFKDNLNGEESAGSVARIRVYDGVLTPDEIATIRATGGLPGIAERFRKAKLVPKNQRKAKRVNTGISLGCPDEAVPCDIRAKVRRDGKKKGVPKVLGKLSDSLRPGGQTVATVKLSKKARKAIKRRGKIKVSIEATVTPGSGVVARATNKGKL